MMRDLLELVNIVALSVLLFEALRFSYSFCIAGRYQWDSGASYGPVATEMRWIDSDRVSTIRSGLSFISVHTWHRPSPTLTTYRTDSGARASSNTDSETFYEF
ncbi:hypothetical protein DAEQUDRAFT_457633 [Daedalea quercina L-15889]|uniref:Uncharacterized protein n=1 Tax=Daedalea quercina L-15889 TaxID=1314783 RepID=A0A165N167_9APHY|nr:hypothetical protein DAEQUDRAFT_457633 [Daedalea quercina L-15889]